MQVLLLQDIKGLGRRFDIKEVKDGFARNFLFPKKLAVPADEQALKIKDAALKEKRHELAKYEALAARLKELTLEFKVRTGEHKEVFGSVKEADILKSLEAHGIAGGHVVLERPLKTLGEHKISVKFGEGVSGEVKVVLKDN